MRVDPDPLLLHGALPRASTSGSCASPSPACNPSTEGNRRMETTENTCIRLLLLDFDGTLADTRRANTLAYVAALAEAGYPLTGQEYAARYFGMRCEEFLTRNTASPTPPSANGLRRRKIALYPSFFGSVRLNRPLWEFCRQFQQPRAAACGWSRPAAAPTSTTSCATSESEGPSRQRRTAERGVRKRRPKRRSEASTAFSRRARHRPGQAPPRLLSGGHAPRGVFAARDPHLRGLPHRHRGRPPQRRRLLRRQALTAEHPRQTRGQGPATADRTGPAQGRRRPIGQRRSRPQSTVRNPAGFTRTRDPHKTLPSRTKSPREFSPRGFLCLAPSGAEARIVVPSGRRGRLLGLFGFLRFRGFARLSGLLRPGTLRPGMVGPVARRGRHRVGRTARRPRPDGPAGPDGTRGEQQCEQQAVASRPTCSRIVAVFMVGEVFQGFRSNPLQRYTTIPETAKLRPESELRPTIHFGLPMKPSDNARTRTRKVPQLLRVPGTLFFRPERLPAAQHVEVAVAGTYPHRHTAGTAQPGRTAPPASRRTSSSKRPA